MKRRPAPRNAFPVATAPSNVGTGRIHPEPKERIWVAAIVID